MIDALKIIECAEEKIQAQLKEVEKITLLSSKDWFRGKADCVRY